VGGNQKRGKSCKVDSGGLRVSMREIPECLFSLIRGCVMKGPSEIAIVGFALHHHSLFVSSGHGLLGVCLVSGVRRREEQGLKEALG